jgi:tetratricopeptide (TPR) repeat protein
MLKNDNRYFIDEEEFNQLGLELYKNYNLVDESIRTYKLAISEYPELFIQNYSYGVLLAETNNQNAKDLFRKCIEIYKNSPDKKEFSQEYENAIKMINKK